MSSRWGDDDENKDEESPQDLMTTESPVDQDGIKTVTSYVQNVSGQQIKTVTKVKVVTKPMRLNKHVLARRNITKFGACAGQGPGAEKHTTYYHYDNITLDLRKKERGEDDEKDDPLNKIGSNGTGDGSIVVCRHCGESGHWTLKCPKRGQIAPKGMSAATADDSVAQVRAARSDGKYVAPGRRGGGKGMGGGSRFDDEVPALRVSDISEDTSEDDLRNLFGRFGNLTRVYLVKDRNTGIPKGVAFINFSSQKDAEAAIEALDGHRWDHLILRVEFAKPREEKPMSEKERTQYILSRQKRQF